MSVPPIPVRFVPRFKVKPWGGRRLESVLGKRLPADSPIGESWEIVSLPNDESVVRDGPLAGRLLSELVSDWGRGLLGSATLVEGRFPLLIKFLDAREHLSVQNHPRPTATHEGPPSGPIKHEAWYVVAADPNAVIFVGFRPGVGEHEVTRAAGTPAIASLLLPRRVKAGDCFYLPSGTPHALGAGVLVAEVQTPSDVTYRLYDWDRVDLDGKPRALHSEAGLRNLRYDVRETEIRQPRSHIAGAFATVTRLVSSEAFLIEKVRLTAGMSQTLPHAEMTIWMVLSGGGEFVRGALRTPFERGDVLLIPADSAETRATIHADTQLLEVKIPVPSALPSLPDRDHGSSGLDVQRLIPLGRPPQ
ncbi:MAG: type I phosphomannose isomerase catalytic subunit [Phycisphaerae bacterium]